MAELTPTDTDEGQEPTGEVTETEEVEGDEGGNEELSPEVLRANLERANKQAAAERIKRQEEAANAAELRAKLAEAKTPEEVKALAEDYEAKVQAAIKDSDRLRAAYEAGLPPELMDRVKGDDFDAMLEDAKFLAELASASQKEPRTPGGGRNPNRDPGDPEPGSGYRAAKATHTF